MKRVSLLFVLALCITKVDAQSVGIGTTNPSANDLLHINAPPGINGLLVQVRSSDKLRVSANGGTTIGSSVAAPANGLYVAGVTNPFGGIRSSTNPINIQSTNDSVEIVAGSNKIVVFANGGIKIVATGNTAGITIDAGTGNLVLKGATVNIKSDFDVTVDAGMNALIKSGINTTVQSAVTTTILGNSLTKINGGLITLNNNGSPAARVGDLVNVITAPGPGNIISGSNTVLIGN